MREKPAPTLDQVHYALARMPTTTECERRDRAVLALTLLTGVRDGALISLKLKHLDLEQERLDQDAREVRTKFSKTFATCFFPVGGEAQAIVASWVLELRETHLWGPDDPLFPSTRIVLGQDGGFRSSGLQRRHWSTAEPVRRIFRAAFQHADLPYFNPHSLRQTLVQLGQRSCQTPEEFKAWSQNLGHEKVLTTLTSYGTVPAHQQAALIRGSTASRTDETVEARIARLEALASVG